MSTTAGKPYPEEGENDWFFDIIINFLRSPRWKTPIMSFIDHYCNQFEDEEENKLEYTGIHTEFKQIVEELICELIAELGVTQEQFMEACDKSASNKIHKKIVDQIVAVDNFVAFRKLMCKRNAELNLQAVKMEANQLRKAQVAEGSIPETPKDIANDLAKKQNENKELDADMKAALKIAQDLDKAEEEEFMRKAIEESEAHDKIAKQQEDEEAMMIQQAIEMSQQEEEERVAQANPEKVAEKVEEVKAPVPEVKVEAPKEEVKEEAKVIESPQDNEPKPDPVAHKIKEIEIIGREMSDREKEKLEQLKKMKADKKKAKKAAKEQDSSLPSVAMSSLPALQMGGRKGGFDKIPDFLSQKAVLKDMTSLNEMDMMQDALDKQQKKNENQPSMAELFKQKSMKAEAAIAESGKSGPSNTEMADRKARLIAQRDALRKQKEDKRQQELTEFNAKTETKDSLFSELKKMDTQLQDKQKNKDEENKKKLDMFRKARADAEDSGKNPESVQIDSAPSKKKNDGLYEIGTDSD